MKKAIAIMMIAVCLLSAGCAKQDDVIEVIVPESAAPVVTPAQPAEATPAPVADYTSPYADKIAAETAKNDDVEGWISIAGTNIDFPIFYGGADDPFFYLSHGADKKESEIGSVSSVFDMDNYENFNTAQNIVVTAHNNRVSYVEEDAKYGMFHELHHVQAVNMGKTTCGFDEKGRTCTVALDAATLPDFSTPEGRIWDISVCGIDAQWEVWAMYEVPEKEPESTLYYNIWWPLGKKNKSIPKDEAAIKEWIDKQVSRSEYNFGATVTTDDQFLTLYTCGDNHDSSTAQSRLYFFLKQVNPVSTKFKAGVMQFSSLAPAAPAASDAPAA